VVLGLAILAGRNGGGSSSGSSLGFAPPVSPAEAAITSVTGMIAEFDPALAHGDFGAACRLLDPWVGVAAGGTAPSDAGIEGSCEERLAGFVRRVGPGLVDALEHASLSDFQLGGSERRGFDAAAQIHVADSIVTQVHWSPIVGVAKVAPHAKVLITC